MACRVVFLSDVYASLQAVIGLHKAERMLASVEGKLKVAKGNVKKVRPRAQRAV